MKKYRKRIADEILKRKLEGKGAVLIKEGHLSLHSENSIFIMILCASK